MDVLTDAWPSDVASMDDGVFDSALGTRDMTRGIFDRTSVFKALATWRVAE